MLKKYMCLVWFLVAKNCKYFIGYKNIDHKFKSLHVMFLSTSAYVKHFDGETK